MHEQGQAEGALKRCSQGPLAGTEWRANVASPEIFLGMSTGILGVEILKDNLENSLKLTQSQQG